MPILYTTFAVYNTEMHSRSALLAALILSVPSLSFAAAFGFPREPLWVSSTSARAGDAITMYAAVYNASDADMKGTVSFLADGEVFDTKDVQLPAGGSSLITNSWPAVKGSHALSAAFASGTQKDSTGKITITVTAAPPAVPVPKSAVEETVSQATDIAHNIVAPSSPVAKVANAVLTGTEAVRTAGANFIRPYATDVPKKTGTANSGKNFTTTTSGEKSLLRSGIQTAAAAALYAFDSKWLFYVLLIIVLYFILRTVKRWATGPRF